MGNLKLVKIDHTKRKQLVPLVFLSLPPSTTPHTQSALCSRLLKIIISTWPHVTVLNYAWTTKAAGQDRAGQGKGPGRNNKATHNWTRDYTTDDDDDDDGKRTKGRECWCDQPTSYDWLDTDRSACFFFFFFSRKSREEIFPPRPATIVPSVRNNHETTTMVDGLLAAAYWSLIILLL